MNMKEHPCKGCRWYAVDRIKTVIDIEVEIPLCDSGPTVTLALERCQHYNNPKEWYK